MEVKTWTPQEVSDLDVAFAASVRHLMPAMDEIPEEFRRDRTPYNKAVDTWFFEGLNRSALRVKDGVDERAAIRHLSCIMRSFGPRHEHKTAAVAYLMSLWFDLVQPQQKKVKPTR
jgi:hypothetical protein